VCHENQCSEVNLANTGSGVIVASAKGISWGITAGHVCKPRGTTIISSNLRVASYSGAVLKARIVQVMEEVDVCVFMVEGASIPPAILSGDAPSVGDSAFSLASPLGIRSPRMVLKLDGTFCGKKRDTIVSGPTGIHRFPLLDAYTIPATSGSSGGGVFNSKGELVGMIILARVGFENFSLSIQYSTLALVVRAVREAALKSP